MMGEVYIRISRHQKNALWHHLLSQKPKVEEASFLYVTVEANGEVTVFRSIEWFPITPDGFASRSELHMELADETKASVIKRAHDLGASLVEFHSHTGPWAAAFSLSDMLGFEEFVPHVWWRLKGRPYFAVVVTESGFDGLAWVSGASTPQRLAGILVEDETHSPSGLSKLKVDIYG